MRAAKVKMRKFVVATITFLFLVTGGILIIAPATYIVGVYTYDWVGIGWEHEPLVPPFQLLEVGLLLGLPIIIIGVFFRHLMRKRSQHPD